MSLNQSPSFGRTPSNKKPIRSCIMITLYGGPSQIDTWDMKPDAPIEIRGEYQPIRTGIPGRRVCEHLPQFARILDRLAIVRSVHHNLGNHNTAMYETLVGRPSTRGGTLLPPSRMQDFPGYGAAISQLTASGFLPPTKHPKINIALPHVMRNGNDLAGQNAGFLGAAHDPLQIVDDPNQAAFRLRNLEPPPGMANQRSKHRQDLLRSVEEGNITGIAGSNLSDFHQRAFELLGSDSVRKAFEITKEPSSTRERYGRHKLGQSMLLARRLVESGVRFVNVNDGILNGQDHNWDSHLKIFPRHRELLPPFDQAFSALITDLERTGLLESTLVIVTGEFGRSPRINKNAGRDHWPSCYSVLLAGGGAEGGATYGSSDRIGAYPDSNPITPGDIAATLFWRFGIDPDLEITDPLGRPFPVATGQPIRALFPGVS